MVHFGGVCSGAPYDEFFDGGCVVRTGLDIGSTTIKCVVLDDDNKLIYSTYERHLSQITEKIAEILDRVRGEIPGVENAPLALSGSAGMGVAQDCGIEFVQEVFATRVAANTFIPGTDVVIELGGEDAKILFLSGGLEVRMNGTCAGGTGAFIDQMATLLNVPLEELDELAKQYEKTYTIASRCGVFAKTDIQPLLNQGARKSDIAESIFNAVVSQTVAGLAQGREIEGQIVYLGGPLTFMSIEKVKHYRGSGNFAFNRPLFESREEYEAFSARHAAANVPQTELKGYTGKAYIGMDAGSTTVKGVVLNDHGELLYSKYLPSKGNPVEIIKGFLEEVYALNPQLNVVSSAVTGYGEDIIKNAFDVDYGIVETIDRQYLSQRGVFLGLRQLFADLCQRLGLRNRGVFQAGTFCQASRRPRLALHGVHEFQRQAGAEGRRDD